MPAARGRGGPSGDPGRAPTRGVPVVHHPWRCTTGRERGRAGAARRDPTRRPHKGHRRAPGPGGPVGRGAGSAASGAAEGRTAARTRARLDTEAGGVEPRGEECVRGHVPERVSGPGGGQPPTVAAERTSDPPPRPPRAPPTTCTFPRPSPRPRTHLGGRKPWPEFMAPQCGRHAFAGIRARSPPTGPGPGRARSERDGLGGDLRSVLRLRRVGLGGRPHRPAPAGA